MYIAELRGKLSKNVTNKEDILTSNVFSFFKYAKRSVFLKKYLQYLGFEISEQDAAEAVFHFWPRYEDYTQPDVVIKTREYYFLIEAKYFSDFSEETHKTKAQLVREVDNGILEAQQCGSNFILLAITADSYKKEDRLSTLPGALMPYCKWTNWQTVAKFLQETIWDRKDLRPEEREFAADLYDLLDKKGLRSFNGLKEIFQRTGRFKLATQVFFDARTANYRGDFIGFEASLSSVKTTVRMFDYIFLYQKKGKFYFTDFLKRKMLPVPITLFFRR